ncbi:MAG TPA: hypothetical protein VK662_14620 [Acidothermaceae bacterium]|jgi:FtsZ-interacting cell division protein ZipA|nr:hypothetical protein [Acidothermaceae bacterium]
MLIIGLLIVVAAAAFAGAVVSENWGGSTYTVHGFGHVLGHLTLAEIFLSGVILAAIFFLGLWVASVSSRIRRRTSNRRRAEARATREERDTLLAERDKLARELDAERTAHPVVTQEVPPQYEQPQYEQPQYAQAQYEPTQYAPPVVAYPDSVMGGDQPVVLPEHNSTAVLR